jgi:hypothetical protein
MASLLTLGLTPELSKGLISSMPVNEIIPGEKLHDFSVKLGIVLR